MKRMLEDRQKNPPSRRDKGVSGRFTHSVPLRGLFLLLSALLICSGCVPKPPPEPRRIEEIRPIPPALRVTSYSLQRRDLQTALSKGSDNAIRLVPVYETVASRMSYEHRVFDVKPNSVYSLLGIQNTDILVAADGYLIKDPKRFVEYVQLLTRENQATIEIRRGGEPRLLKYTFLPALN